MRDVVLQILVVLGVLNAPLILAALLIWLERRFLALLQDRYGPGWDRSGSASCWPT